VSERSGVGNIVGHRHKRRTACTNQAPHVRAQGGTRVGIQPRERLVKQQDCWIAGKGAFERNALPLSA